MDELIILSICFLWSTRLLLASSTSLTETLQLKTAEDVSWILVGKTYSIDCQLITNVSKPIKISWTKNKKKIPELSLANVKEIRISRTFIQLKFLNASKEEAGAYVCIAEDEHGQVKNSTTHVNIGSLEKFHEYKCSFDLYSNTLWFSPVLQSADNIIGLKFCQSLFGNNFCFSNHSVWYNATCDNKRHTCMLRVTPRATYIIRTIINNMYGSVSVKTVLKYPSSCMDENPEITKVYLLEDNMMQIQWMLPPRFILANLVVTENVTAKEIVNVPIDSRQGSKTIGGEKLKPCTLYTICIKLFRSSEKTCRNERTRNGYIIPRMKNVRMTNNIVKKTIEIHWKDPTEGRIGPFYYKCELSILKETKQVYRVIRNVTGSTFSAPQPNGTQLIFTINKCTTCGCGYGETTVFPFSVKPDSRPQKGTTNSDDYMVPLISCIAALLVLLIVVLVKLRWLRRNRPPPQPEPRNEILDPPEEIVPLQHHHYEEVLEVDHYKQQEEQNRIAL